MKGVFRKIGWILLAAAIVCLFVPFVVTDAHAETYSIGTVPIPLTYGDELPVFEATQIPETSNYYKIRNCVGSLVSVSGDPIPLTGGDGRVNVAPGIYYMDAYGNVDGTDAEGNVIGGVNCSGTVVFQVSSKSLTLNVAPANLAKYYGDEIASISWTFRNPADNDPSLTIVLASDGTATSAGVGTYPVSVASVTKNETDVSSYYSITAYSGSSTEAASVTVSEKPMVFVYSEEQEVLFNSFLLPDGESVYSMEKTGANGETVTLFFRLTEEETLLTIGTSYPIEAYRYLVTPSVGDPVSYAMSDASDYDVTADLTAASTVKAKVGGVTLFQDATKIEARASDPSFVYIDPSVLTLTYLDDALMNFSGNVTFEGIELYPNISIDLTCSFVCGETTVPTGVYALTFVSFEGESVNSVALDELSLTVVKRVVGVLSDPIDREYGYAEDLVLPLDRVYSGKTYSFELTAPTAGMSVGEETPFASLLAITDENVTVDYSAAIVRIVKRTTGVSFVRKESTDAVVYGESYDPFEVYLNYEQEGETLLSETLVYSHIKKGETLSRSGLPTQIGSYDVTCSLQSDRYSVSNEVFEVAVVKRPVVAYYEITRASKTYGETFVFSPETVQLRRLFFYDVALGAADRSKEGLVDGSDIKNAIGGTGLSSRGGDKSAAVGLYEYDLTGLTSPIYEVKGVILLDLSTKTQEYAGNEVSVFTVSKAEKPSGVEPVISISGRAVVVSAKDGETSLEAQLSEKANFSSAETASGSVSANFTGKKYGVVYYVRLRVSDDANYNEATGDWSEATTFVIPFPKPNCELVGATSSSFAFKAVNPPSALAAGAYVFQHKIGDGEWTEGLEITDLKADTSYTIRFRAFNAAAEGSEATLTERTLRAPVEKSKVKVSFDKEQGVLTVNSDLTLEYRLWDEDEMLLEDWTDAVNFEDVLEDSTYILEVREAALSGKKAGESTKITVSTFPEKKEMKINFFSKWFLLIVGGIALVVLIVIAIVFIKVKRRVDTTEFGGK